MDGAGAPSTLDWGAVLSSPPVASDHGDVDVIVTWLEEWSIDDFEGLGGFASW